MKLFQSIAGVSDHTFVIGNVEFMAAPFTILEYQQYGSLPDDPDSVGEQLEFLAEKLRRRIKKGMKADPATITAEWLMENLELPKKPILEHVLVYGKLPAEEGENTKASTPPGPSPTPNWTT